MKKKGHQSLPMSLEIMIPRQHSVRAVNQVIKDWNRRIEVNVRLNQLKQEARQNLTSEVGIALRKKRSIEPEYVFGQIRWCWGFKRFLLRGMEKVKVEWGLLCIAYNISRMATVQWA